MIDVSTVIFNIIIPLMYISVEMDDESRAPQKVEMNDDSCVQKKQMDEEIIPSWMLDHLASLNDIAQDDDHEDDHKDDDDDAAIKESTMSHTSTTKACSMMNDTASTSTLLLAVEEDSDRIDLHIDTTITTITHDHHNDLCIDTAFDSMTIKQYFPDYYFNDERDPSSSSNNKPYIRRVEVEKEAYITYSRSNSNMMRTFSNHDMGCPSVEPCCEQSSSCIPPVTLSIASTTTNLSDLFEIYTPSPPSMLMIDTTAEVAPSSVDTNTPTSELYTTTTGQLLLSSSSSVSMLIPTKEKIKAQSPLPLVRTPHYHTQLSPSCPPSNRRNATSYLM